MRANESFRREDRDDGMGRHERAERPSGSAFAVGWRNGVGAVLLLAGLLIGGWVVYSIAGLVTAETPPPVVAAVTPASDAPVELGTPEGPVTIPDEVFLPVGYGILCVLYAIAAGVSGTMIRGGVALLRPGSKS